MWWRLHRGGVMLSVGLYQSRRQPSTAVDCGATVHVMHSTCSAVFAAVAPCVAAAVVAGSGTDEKLS
jgi:hypothetical protein